jgi:hypothetical protein
MQTRNNHNGLDFDKMIPTVRGGIDNIPIQGPSVMFLHY